MRVIGQVCRKEEHKLNPHQISEYIDNLPLQKKFCKGYRPDEVYEVICTLSSMYNQILSESYEENEELKRKVGNFEVSSEQEKVRCKAEQTENGNEMDKTPAVLSEKELKHLKRGELLEIMLEQSRENDALRLQQEKSKQLIKDMQLKLDNRRIAIKEAGSIADAALCLNGVFDAAQLAAQQYLENLQDLYKQEKNVVSKNEAETRSRCAAMIEETRLRCERMEAETAKRCEEMEDAATKQCDFLLKEAEEKCRALDIKAKEEVDKRWASLAERLEAFYNQKPNVEEIRTAADLV